MPRRSFVNHSCVMDSIFGFPSARQKRQLTEAAIERMEPENQLNSGH